MDTCEGHILLEQFNDLANHFFHIVMGFLELSSWDVLTNFLDIGANTYACMSNPYVLKNIV